VARRLADVLAIGRGVLISVVLNVLLSLLRRFF
jgi:hypothetical protein